jgi:hypothetical protein
VRREKKEKKRSGRDIREKTEQKKKRYERKIEEILIMRKEGSSMGRSSSDGPSDLAGLPGDGSGLAGFDGRAAELILFGGVSSGKVGVSEGVSVSMEQSRRQERISRRTRAVR